VEECEEGVRRLRRRAVWLLLVAGAGDMALEHLGYLSSVSCVPGDARGLSGVLHGSISNSREGRASGAGLGSWEGAVEQMVARSCYLCAVHQRLHLTPDWVTTATTGVSMWVCCWVWMWVRVGVGGEVWVGVGVGGGVGVGVGVGGGGGGGWGGEGGGGGGGREGGGVGGGGGGWGGGKKGGGEGIRGGGEERLEGVDISGVKKMLGLKVSELTKTAALGKLMCKEPRLLALLGAAQVVTHMS